MISQNAIEMIREINPNENLTEEQIETRIMAGELMLEAHIRSKNKSENYETS